MPGARAPDRLGGAAVSEQSFAAFDARVSRYAYLVSLLPELIVARARLPIRLARRSVSSYTPDPRAGAGRGLLVDAGDPDATARSFTAVAGGPRAQAAWRVLLRDAARVARARVPDA